MKSTIKKIPQYIFIAINLLVVVAMNFCAYTTHLNSQTYPNYSWFGMIFPAFLLLSIAFMVFWLIFKKRFMLISILGMLLCGSSIRCYCPLNYPTAPPEGSIKLMSYNVMGFGKHDTIPWEENEIVQYIRKSQADIVCLQEAHGTKKTALNELFDSIYPYQLADTIKKEAYTAILSKYPILSGERINYESTTNASFAYRLLVNGDTVLVVNNHLESYKLNDKDKDNYKTIIQDPENEENEQRYDSLIHKLKAANTLRAAQADSVADYICKHPHKYVICVGDFNAPSLSYTHYRLTQLLDDAYTRSGNGPGISYNRSGMYFRIDNILISSNITPYRAKVDAFSKMSDHYPIISYLKFGKE
ncbi:MAG: endonuclease/exonuclease/phosphatase family protein [Bacteroidaceae bacterium]|nr:endonuclease/exonuclease/phosphatase family protein [Bacteroidaceae bacterium]